MTTVVATPADLKTLVGKELGVSDWVTVDQDRIDQFADATGDHQWIHVDVERARREFPLKTTIAHGFLTLSLVAGLTPEVYRIERTSRSINYGLNKVRFTNMVPAGARVRLRQTLRGADDVDAGGIKLTVESVIEIEGEKRPAVVAETISIKYP
ncbi:MAG: MaoC family dehydratase [Alphaproteobacteria bacterium]